MEVKGLEKELPETNKENYILRVCRSNYHTKEEIGNELFFMQSIAKYRNNRSSQLKVKKMNIFKRSSGMILRITVPPLRF